MNHAEKKIPFPPVAFRLSSAGARHRNQWREYSLLTALALLLWTPWTALAAGTNAATAPILFPVGMTKICFHNVNPEDATAAFRIFLERQALQFGFVIKADAKMFDETPIFETAIQHQPMLMAVVDAGQFLAMDIHRQMKPFFLVAENGKTGRKFLVLTRHDSGLNTLAALRGRKILRLDVASLDMVNLWLDTRLLSEKLGTREKFFGSVETVTKPTAAVLPVFFGKQAACIVDEGSFEMMKELNPQVGQQLQAVAVSDQYANPVVCLREDGWPTAEQKMTTIQALKELHLNPVGQQICTLFKIDRMVPFEDSQLDTIRKLRATYESLQKGAKP